MQRRLIWPLLVAAVASGQTITNFAGNGLVGYQGDRGPATLAQVSNVLGLAADAAGNIYLADQDNHVVRKVDTRGIITTFAGVGLPGFRGDNGLAALAPNGHYAFTLRVDEFNVANIRNIRGTIEFLSPNAASGVAIGTLGFRIPSGAPTTYTTLPALARQ